ncbi:FAD-dependent monooxygenase [Nocardia sp. NPDC003693]
MRGKGSAIVVGGSIGGLTAAIALARRGIRTTVLESRDTFDGRAGLGADYLGLCAVTGEEPEDALAHIYGHRPSVGCNALHGWLAEVAGRVIGLDLRLGVDVTKVDQDDDFAFAATGSEEFEADVLIGADGDHSLVRAAVDPGHVLTDYTGFLTWRGWIAETALPAGTSLPGAEPLRAGDQLLTAVALPGLSGLRPSKGLRTTAFVWHDPTRMALLEELGCLREGKILHGLEPEHFPPGLSAELIDTARRTWPDPWRGAIVDCLERGTAFGTPSGDYLPERITNGRIGLMGAAAHTVTPAISTGHRAAAADALALDECLRDGVLGSRAVAALANYQDLRLRPARDLVHESRRWTDAHRASAR